MQQTWIKTVSFFFFSSLQTLIQFAPVQLRGQFIYWFRKRFESGVRQKNHRQSIISILEWSIMEYPSSLVGGTLECNCYHENSYTGGERGVYQGLSLFHSLSVLFHSLPRSLSFYCSYLRATTCHTSPKSQRTQWSLKIWLCIWKRMKARYPVLPPGLKETHQHSHMGSSADGTRQVSSQLLTAQRKKESISKVSTKHNLTWRDCVRTSWKKKKI